MGCSSLGGRGTRIDGRARERMPPVNLRTSHLDKPCSFAVADVGHVKPEGRRRSYERRKVVCIRGRQQYEELTRLRNEEIETLCV